MTMVADVKRPDMTAREEANTVIGDPVKVIVDTPHGGEGAGVGYGLTAASLLFILLEEAVLKR